MLQNWYILVFLIIMSETEGTDLKGVVRLRIDKVAELGAEATFSPAEKIAKLPWYFLKYANSFLKILGD